MVAGGRFFHAFTDLIDQSSPRLPQAGELHFLVSEYVEGMSLARLVDKYGPRPVVNACNYVRQAAIGLQHAFEKGMVHRDIKPQNLMLTPKGQVKILDFGLARFARESEPQTASPPDVETQAGGLTALGTVLGTPDYMAPEQTTDSHKADIRADIYSLGCTLYFLLAGHPPFPTGTMVQKLKLHRQHTPRPLNELRDDLPADLLQILDKMMAKDPVDRYQTPAEVAQAIASHARPSAAPEPPPVQTAPPIAEKDLSSILETPVTNLSPPASYEWKPWPQGNRPRKKPLGFQPQTLVFGFVALLSLSLLIAYSMSLGTGDSPDSNHPTAAGIEPQPKNAKAAAPRTPATQSVKARILFVLPGQNFWNPDYVPVRHYLEEQGARVTVASTASPARPDPGGGGEPVTPDLRFEDARAADYDAIIFCGASVWEFASGERQRFTRDLVDEMLVRKKIVSALCKGPHVLANVGKLKDVRATSFPPWAEKLREAGARWVDEPVVVSGQIVTGRSPQDADEFARVLWEELQKGR